MREMVEENLEEKQRKTVEAVERNETLLELGIMGLPGMALVERTKQAKEMMRKALTDIMMARGVFTIVRIGDGEEKEKHLENLYFAEEFFTKKYEAVFGKFEAITDEKKD